ncbi:adenine nucleotide alpha hydrolase family protein, partial [Candidatus Woesearchaeota archaeon]|nr:adenine nucleotide alpha hydrolase family protein [Candidatus Woesearchaeota archaeon]
MPKKCVKCGKPELCSGFCRSHFKKYFDEKVRKTIKKFQLFGIKEKVGVAVSGGKDSTVLLYVLKKLGYDVVGLTVDAYIGNYTKKNLENLREVCKKHKIELKEISFKKEFGYSLCYIKSILKEKGQDYASCLLCGVLRRYLINKYAREMKLDVITTGHTLDDEAQAFLMNIFRNDPILAMRQGPITGLGGNKHFVKRAKPLYLCSEKETTTYSKLMEFPVNYDRCPCSVDAYRRNFRDFLDNFEKKHPSVKYNIVNFFLETLHKQKKEKYPDKIMGFCSS